MITSRIFSRMKQTEFPRQVLYRFCCRLCLEPPLPPVTITGVKFQICFHCEEIILFVSEMNISPDSTWVFSNSIAIKQVWKCLLRTFLQKILGIIWGKKANSCLQFLLVVNRINKKCNFEKFTNNLITV